jgi:hypothetical protein
VASANHQPFFSMAACSALVSPSIDSRTLRTVNDSSSSISRLPPMKEIDDLICKISSTSFKMLIWRRRRFLDTDFASYSQELAE